MADRDSTPSTPDEITPAIADAMTTDIIHYIEDTLLPEYGLTDSARNLVDAMEGIYRAWCGKGPKRSSK